MKKILQLLTLILCFGLVFLVLKEKTEKAELTEKFTKKISHQQLTIEMLEQKNIKVEKTLQFVKEQSEADKIDLRQKLVEQRSECDLALAVQDSLHLVETERLLEKFKAAFNEQKRIFEQRLKDANTAHQRMINKNNSKWKQRIKNMFFDFPPPSQLDFPGRKPNAKPIRLDSSETQMRVPAKLPENYGDKVIDVSIAIILLTILTAALQGLFRKRRRFRL